VAGCGYVAAPTLQAKARRSLTQARGEKNSAEPRFRPVTRPRHLWLFQALTRRAQWRSCRSCLAACINERGALQSESASLTTLLVALRSSPRSKSSAHGTRTTQVTRTRSPTAPRPPFTRALQRRGLLSQCCALRGTSTRPSQGAVSSSASHWLKIAVFQCVFSAVALRSASVFPCHSVLWFACLRAAAAWPWLPTPR
jgi:hypothetical protein